MELPAHKGLPVYVEAADAGGQPIYEIRPDGRPERVCEFIRPDSWAGWWARRKELMPLPEGGSYKVWAGNDPVATVAEGA